jgi:hypothetical protein
MNVAEITGLGTEPVLKANTLTAAVFVKTNEDAYRLELVEGVELSSV